MQKGILLLAICLGIVLQAGAQDTTRISLNEAIDIALENNYQLKQAQNNLEMADERVFSAKADFLPNLNASMSGSRGIGQQFNNIELRYLNQTAHSISGSFSANITIFNGFSNIMNLKQSQVNQGSQEANLERTRETVIFQAASRYLTVLLDKELLQIARENLEASRKQLEQVRAQVEVGSRPTVDQYNQEATVANNELTVLQRENTLDNDKALLIRTLQLDPMKNYDFVVPELSSGDVRPSTYDLANLTQQALSTRADLQAQELQIQAREYDIKLARAGLMPSISAGFRVSTSYGDQYRGVEVVNGSPERTIVDFNDQFFDQRIFKSFGISMNIPIFNNWNTRTNLEQAKINYKNALLNFEDQTYGVQQEVRQAYTDYMSYRKQLQQTETALRAAEKNYETQRQRYNVGASTLIELSDANAQYVQAQSNHVQALYRLIFQQKLLDYYIGKLDQDISLNN